MTYSPNSPLPQNSPKQDQPQIKTNYGQWDAVFKENHTALNSNAQGTHSEVVFKNQTVDPDITGTWGTVYSKTGTGVANQPNLFWRTFKFLPDQDNNPIQLTFNQVVKIGTQQQSFIAGGYIVYFGTATSSGAGVVTFAPGGVPACTKVVYASAQLIPVGTFTTTTFTILQAALSVNYFVIGRM